MNRGQQLAQASKGKNTKPPPSSTKTVKQVKKIYMNQLTFRQVLKNILSS